MDKEHKLNTGGAYLLNLNISKSKNTLGTINLQYKKGIPLKKEINGETFFINLAHSAFNYNNAKFVVYDQLKEEQKEKAKRVKDRREILDKNKNDSMEKEVSILIPNIKAYSNALVKDNEIYQIQNTTKGSRKKVMLPNGNDVIISEDSKTLTIIDTLGRPIEQIKLKDNNDQFITSNGSIYHFEIVDGKNNLVETSHGKEVNRTVINYGQTFGSVYFSEDDVKVNTYEKEKQINEINLGESAFYYQVTIENDQKYLVHHKKGQKPVYIPLTPGSKVESAKGEILITEMGKTYGSFKLGNDSKKLTK